MENTNEIRSKIAALICWYSRLLEKYLMRSFFKKDQTYKSASQLLFLKIPDGNFFNWLCLQSPTKDD